MKINHIQFLDTVLSLAKDLGIELGNAKIDHIAYQASSEKDYDLRKDKLLIIATLVKEPLVGGRRVGVFKFKKPLMYKDQNIETIELVEPEKGQKFSSGLEHAEYLLDESLEEFMSRYPDVNWNTSSLNRAEFPMLKLKLSKNIRIKFPRYPILRDV